jgi:uncharacterized protein YdhG (YjbR/CyaY superfamily)
METKNNTKAESGVQAVNRYLASVPEPARSTLEALRRIIRQAAPEAVEAISYQVPTFKQHGNLVGFAAFKNHCSFFPMNSAVIAAFQDELQGFETSKGTIRFTPEKPLPDELVQKIVAARLAENEGKRKT